MRGKLRLIFAVVSFVSSSCSKSAETVVDCIAEALMVSVNHNVSPTNSKEILFNISYSGTLTISSVTWNYGDGKTETLNGTSATHTYSQAGPYTVSKSEFEERQQHMFTRANKKRNC
jgi:PKD repeat protein